MIKTCKYAKLVSITFSLGMHDIYDLLRKAGEVPEHFEFDYENTDKTDNFEVIIRRITETAP